MEQTFFYEAMEQTLIIHLPEELDHHNCKNLRYETDLLMAENYIHRLVFDFSRTTFMDSSGIGILMGRYKKVSLFGGRVLAIHVNDRLKKVMQMAGICEFIEILD